MKCEASEKGFLRNPDNPEWICQNEGTHNIELNRGDLMTGQLCEGCLSLVMQHFREIGTLTEKSQ